MPDELRPTRHVYQVYVYAVCFVTVLILLFTAASFVYAIVRIAAPGTTAQGGFGGLSFFRAFGDAFGSGFASEGERDRGIVQLIQSGILGIGAGALFYVHWGWANRLRTEEDRASRYRKPEAPSKPRTRKPRPAPPPPSEAGPEEGPL